MDDWRSKLIDDEEGIARIVRGAKRIAVLGMKTEEQRNQPAFYVPKALHDAGVEIIPVPVYFPEVKQILGKPIYRKVRDVPGPIDIVDVFRRSHDVPPHLEDLLAAKPRCVWLQLGIRHDPTAEQLARAGIEVVQDRCLMVDFERYV
jgi:predicted CoA-binding protein